MKHISECIDEWIDKRSQEQKRREDLMNTGIENAKKESKKKETYRLRQVPRRASTDRPIG
jgi:hypothetical protein